MTQQQFKVAIIGGGLSGALFMRGLRRLPHMDVHIYESAATFREVGAGIAIQDSTSSALRAIDPDIFECMQRAGVVPIQEATVFVASGPDAGKQVDSFTFAADSEPEADFRGSIARQPLLRELLADVPPEKMHAGMKLAAVDDSGVSSGTGRYVLTFHDGSRADFDMVIGADGLHGRTRNYVLGDGHAEYAARPVGVWHARLTIPFTEGKAVFGDFMDEVDISQRAWVGHRTFILNDFLNNKETVQLIVNAAEPETLVTKEWRFKMSHAEFRQRLAGQMPHLSEGVVGLYLKHNPDPFEVFCQFSHPPVPTYYRGRVCMVGDAAHTMSPAASGGGSMATEDAAILCALLARTDTLADVERALKVWDGLRRPRCDKVVQLSEERMFIMLGHQGNSQAYLNEHFNHGKRYIRSWRAPPAVAEAVAQYEALA